MSVYVDDMRAPLGQMLMCHMIADSHQELMAMAHRVGLKEKYLQLPNTYKEHFDLCQSKRAKAVLYGARQVTQKDLGAMLLARRKLQEVMTQLKTMKPVVLG
jgi:hypothetical protein